MVPQRTKKKKKNFSNQFILDRVVEDLQSIPGTLCARWESSLDGTPVLHNSPHTFSHSITHREQFNPPTGTFLGGGRKLEKPGEPTLRTCTALDRE